MPKKESHPSHLQSPPLSRKQRGRKLIVRLVGNTGKKGNSDTISRGLRSVTLTPSSSLSPSPKRRYAFFSRLRWWLLWLSLLSIVGASVATGILLLTKLPPPVDCQRISRLSADGDRLYCAQQAAESGKLEQLLEAIALVGRWPREHPLYSEAQRLMEEWSRDILNLAQQKLDQGDLSGAVAIASKIPTTSPVHSEAQAAITNWKQEWNQGEDAARKFKDALVVQNWSRAFQMITTLAKSKREYWSITRVDAMMKQLDSEKQAWQQLEEARDLAQSNQVEELAKAINLAATVNPNSYVKAQAQTELSKWSRSLVQIAVSLLDKEDFEGTINALQPIPVNTSLYQEAQDWMQLSRASAMAKKGDNFALIDALAAIHQVDAKSPVYKRASSKASLWQAYLQDLTRLQLAQSLANVGQRVGLEMAIEQAAQVAQGRPKRVVAQTLIAQWRKEIDHIEDRNTLLQAQQVAQEGSMDALRKGVELASQIRLGQPLRGEAQNAIAKWNRQIQILEDRPVLDLARALAQQQDLNGAISTAQQIRAERALYTEAQKAIRGWVAQIQMAQDRPILEAAAALAQQGRLDAAIATASQITPDRALYPQAQAAIANWTNKP
ncbi:MAG TPA: hypothetical protein V6C95_23255 [Coleofasciculaceae cyanobacterium]